jgi:hypothetical protein
MFTNIFAITHLFDGFDYKNENIIYRIIVDSYDCYYFSFFYRSFAVNSYCFDTFNKNNNPNS